MNIKKITLQEEKESLKMPDDTNIEGVTLTSIEVNQNRIEHANRLGVNFTDDYIIVNEVTKRELKNEVTKRDFKPGERRIVGIKKMCLKVDYEVPDTVKHIEIEESTIANSDKNIKNIF